MTASLISLLIGQVLFAKAYGGADYDYVGSIAQNQDGGYIIAGSTSGFGAGAYDCLVLKIDSDGTIDWAKTFGGQSNDGAVSVIKTMDGGYAVAGRTWSFGAGLYDFLVFKLDPSGNLSWAKTFGGTDEERAYSIVQTQDGGYAVAGFTYSFGAGECDFLVIRLDASGNLLWAKTFGGPGTMDEEKAYSIVQTQDGGYAVAGFTYSFGTGWDFLVIKLDASGNLSWAKKFGGTDYEEAWSIIQTTDQGYAVVGRTYSFGAGDNDLLFVKLDPSGNLSLAKTFGGTRWDGAYSIIQTVDGGYAVAGYTESLGTGGDFLVLKLDPSGNPSWTRTFGGTSSDLASSVIQTADGGYAVAGYTWSFSAGMEDFFVLRLDRNGNYPGCVQESSLTVMSPPLNAISSPIIVNDASPLSLDPAIAITASALTVKDACASQDVKELNPKSPNQGITCSFVPGAMLVNSPDAMRIKIYSPNGQILYSGEIKKGQNRIPLGAGAYIWIVGTIEGNSPVYKGKAVVK
ncbi:MAG: hypothetical protein ABIM88_00220 [candidate division WOR-3 bacterium]